MGEKITERILKLFEVKSLVTLGLTGGMLALLFGPFQPPQEITALFCTSYGAIITYFFTRKEG
jgi:hypothetical protein